jgi:hypothetical protein
MIEIKSRWDGKVLYTAENAQDVRAALVEAAGKRAYLQGAYLQGADLQGADLQGADLQGADLQGAYLQGAYLQGADLQGAYLQGAYLQGADLQGADLQGADLQGADLQGAYLQGAYLQGADLQGDVNSPSYPLHFFRADYWSILDQAPGDVDFLRTALIEGRVNGSVYRDDSGCGCLTGTIAIHHGCDIRDLAKETGVVPDAGRPAEQWFIDIAKGDKPLPIDTKEWPNESVFRLSYALAWLDEWVESRTAIAKAFNDKEAARGGC